MNALSAEVKSIETFTIEPEQLPDIFACAKDVIEALAPNFSANQINLELGQLLMLLKTGKLWEKNHV